MYLNFIVAYTCLFPIYYFIGKRLKLNSSVLVYIYIYRAIFSIGYMFYASGNPADANQYIAGNQEGFYISGQSLALGTPVINSIINLAKYINIENYSLYGLFGLFG